VTRERVLVSPYCLAADAGLAGPEAHDRCRRTRPLFLPGIPTGTTPVLPQVPCACPCHLETP
jgi:hypothetical protein